MNHPSSPVPPRLSRRDFLWNSGGGLGGIALASMLGMDPMTASAHSGALGGVLHHPPKAKRVIQLFMSGAASHIDLWDHKPWLDAHHGEASDFGEKVELFQNGAGPWTKSYFQFRPYGE